jgi:hypothetical protein
MTQKKSFCTIQKLFLKPKIPLKIIIFEIQFIFWECSYVFENYHPRAIFKNYIYKNSHKREDSFLYFYK